METIIGGDGGGGVGEMVAPELLLPPLVSSSPPRRGGDGELAGIPVDPGTGGCFRDSSVDGEVVRGWASYGVGNLKDGVRRGRRRARAKWIAKMVDWNYARTSATQANANESRSYSGETWLRDAVQEKPWDDNLIIANTI
jgi:hypothetical protein